MVGMDMVGNKLKGFLDFYLGVLVILEYFLIEV